MNVQRRSKFRPNLYHRLTPDARFTVPDVTALDDSVVPSPVSGTFSEGDHKLKKEKEREAEFEAEAKVNEEPNRPVSAPPDVPSAHPGNAAKKRFSIGSIKEWLGKRKEKAKPPCPCDKPLRKQDNVNPAADPVDDDIRITDVLEVWFAGCHGGTSSSR